MTFSPLVILAIYLSALFSPEMVILFCWFLITIAVSVLLLRRVKLKNIFRGPAPSIVRASVMIVGSTALATILSQVFKRIFQVARPVDMLILETGFSFPSGHATVSTAFFSAAIVAMYLFYKNVPMPLRRLVVAVSILLIIGICSARLVLNVHRIEDVVFGLVIGLVSTLFVQSFFKKDSTVEYIHGNNSHTSH